MALSLMAIPSLVESTKSPVSSMQIWRGIYDRGKKLGPAMGVATLAAYGLAAYAARQDGLPWAQLVGAGVLTAGIMPFTVLVMAPTNSRLLAGAAGSGEVSVQTAVGWLQIWSRLNFVRGVFPLAGAAVGLQALLGYRS
jgi:hypothetical protein